ncbi:7679_t:CDS:2 [Ambispora leptoticha]|uniref:Galactokinase n=1 Tax=Ambispora leptoticha TaxID=144679 RepID=A0A9N8ZZ11_9GLOM|nr:7679_t:CDS:2 [Ambispora leptoticha]
MVLEFLNELSHDFTKLLENKQDSDFSITIGSEPDNVKVFHLHRLILRARSPFFAAIFNLTTTKTNTNKIGEFSKNADSSNNQLAIKNEDLFKNTSPAIFEVIVKFLYGGAFNVKTHSLDELFEILVTAHKFRVKSLTSYLEEYLTTKRADDLRQKFAQLTKIVYENSSLTKLQSFHNDATENAAETIFECEDFTSLSEATLVSLLRIDSLRLKEIEIWEKVIKWGIFQCQNLPADFSSWTARHFETLRVNLSCCIPLIRFFDISSEDFHQKVLPYQQIIPDQILKDLIDYHRAGYAPITPILPSRSPFMYSSTLLRKQHARFLSRAIEGSSSINGISTPCINSTSQCSYEFRLILRGSRDGFSPSIFHRFCDGKGPTITVIKIANSEKLIGGYCPFSWQSKGGYQYTTESFIFQLHEQTCKNGILSRVVDPTKAVYFWQTFGPGFGNGPDLALRENFKDPSQSFCRQKSYEEPIIPGADRRRVHFTTEEYERYDGCSPSFIARSPGRVNLIGEHIDYAGFGVLPMAISRDVLIAVSYEDTNNNNGEIVVEISNIQNTRYPDRKFVYQGKERVVDIENEEGVVEWGNYFKCGYKGALQYLQLNRPKGMRCLIDGNVPEGGGLSSSAAFTCCAVLATCFANGAQLNKIQLTEIAASCERFIGLGTGNMDQTASICSLLDHALYIEFLPTLTPTPIKLPTINPPLAFVIANSLTKADKVATAPTNYNLRVVETKIAAYYLGRQLFDKDCEILRNVVDLYDSDNHKKGVTIEKLNALSHEIDRLFEKKQEGYRLSELSILLELDVSEIKRRFIGQYTIRAETFHLYKRAKHVIEESLRVLKFYEACVRGCDADDHSKSEELFDTLSKLMNQSHASCRDLYDCSCKELDQLVEICLGNGAKGSRLTGAGWGGCTVSLVPLNMVNSFIHNVREKYYRPLFPNLSKAELSNVIFATTPGSGAAVIIDL